MIALPERCRIDFQYVTQNATRLLGAFLLLCWINDLRHVARSHYNPDPSEGPWGRWSIPPHGGAVIASIDPTLCGSTLKHEGRRQTDRRSADAGSRLKLIDAGGRSRLIRQRFSRNGENSPYGIMKMRPQEATLVSTALPNTAIITTSLLLIAAQGNAKPLYPLPSGLPERHPHEAQSTHR
jgi:hypothetical protein